LAFIVDNKNQAVKFFFPEIRGRRLAQDYAPQKVERNADSLLGPGGKGPRREKFPRLTFHSRYDYNGSISTDFNNKMLYTNILKPLYEQLKDRLRASIENAEYKPDEALPSERALMEMYKVSRVTVRQALGDLVDEGLLYRKKGSGTFVAGRIEDRPLTKFLGFAEELLLSGYNVTVRLIKTSTMRASSEVAKELQLETGESVIYFERVTCVEENPILVSYNYLSGHLDHVVATIDLNKDIILEQLELRGYDVAYGIQHIKAASASNHEGGLLKCPAGTPVLAVTRTAYLSGGIPISYTKGVFRPEYSFFTRLKRK